MKIELEQLSGTWIKLNDGERFMIITRETSPIGFRICRWFIKFYTAMLNRNPMVFDESYIQIEKTHKE